MTTLRRIRRLRTGALLAFALLGTLGLAGCGAAPAQLAGRDFLSIAVTDGGAPRPLVAGTRILLTFTAVDLGGSAGCNHFGGTYRIDDGRLLFEAGGMTAMGCDPQRDAQDQWLVGLLGSKPSISLVGPDLTVTSGSVVLTLRDREVVEPDAQLVGPTWTVESIIAGDTVSSVPAEPVATLLFRQAGTVEVNTGCNRGSGTWSAVGGGIAIGPLLLTKMACQQDAANLESAVVTALSSGTFSATIDGPVLTLLAGKQGLQLRAR